MTHGVGFWYYRVVLAGGISKGGFVCSQRPEEQNEDKPLPPLPQAVAAAPIAVAAEVDVVAVDAAPKRTELPSRWVSRPKPAAH